MKSKSEGEYKQEEVTQLEQDQEQKQEQKKVSLREFLEGGEIKSFEEKIRAKMMHLKGKKGFLEQLNVDPFVITFRQKGPIIRSFNPDGKIDWDVQFNFINPNREDVFFRNNRPVISVEEITSFIEKVSESLGIENVMKKTKISIQEQIQ